MTRGREHLGRDDTKANLVGGGIASLASAAYLIRDGGIAEEHIVILEATDVIGGSLDGDGSPQHSYVLRDGRMSSSTVRRGPPPISPYGGSKNSGYRRELSGLGVPRIREQDVGAGGGYQQAGLTTRTRPTRRSARAARGRARVGPLPEDANNG